MRTLYVLYHTARADWLERVRQYGFLLVLGGMVAAGYAFVPPATAGYASLDLGGTRGVYNSAWLGTMMAMITSLLLSLAGFYLVKNSIQRDQDLRMDQIIAATPISKFVYLAGKWLSHLAVLFVMSVVLILITLFMQWMRGEVREIDLLALISPFVWILWPTLAFVAALAVLFETIPLLRGGVGNILYFFVWTTLLVLTMQSNESDPASQGAFDLFGVFHPIAMMKQAAAATGLTSAPDGALGFIELAQAPTTFIWEGLSYDMTFISSRLFWVGLALLVVLGSGLVFRRFVPAAAPSRSRSRKRKQSASPLSVPFVSVTEAGDSAPQRVRAAHLTPVKTVYPFFSLLAGEWKLASKTMPVWWWGVFALLIAGSFLLPLEAVKRWVWPLLWFWPILIWSQMGTREKRSRTEALVFAAPRLWFRQTAAIWLIGAGFATVGALGVLVRDLLAGDLAHLTAAAVGILFVPTLALALGALSSSSKLFEIVYTFIWFNGPVNQQPFLDFMSTTEMALTQNMALTFGLYTLVLLMVALIGRKQQFKFD